jgi:hypothetical protein
MAEISAQVEMRVYVRSGQDPVALERAIAAEGRRAARELYLWVLEAKDEQAVTTAGGARQRREARWVATLFGRVRIRRYRINHEAESFHPLDRALGLGRGEASQAVRVLVRELAQRLSHRDVARAVTAITGEPITYQHVNRLLRQHRN